MGHRYGRRRGLIKFKNNIIKAAAAIVLTVLVLTGVYFSFPMIASAAAFLLKISLPFILGYLFALLVKPPVEWLSKRLKLPRQISAVLVMILSLGVVGSIIGFGVIKIVEEVRNLYMQLPAIVTNAQTNFQRWGDKWNIVYSAMPENVQNILTNMYDDFMTAVYAFINNKSSPIVSYAGNVAKSLPNIFISVIVFILSSFFILSSPRANAQKGANTDAVSLFLSKHISEVHKEKIEKVKDSIKRYLGGYIKAQLTIMSIAFVILFTGLSILKIEYALLIAVAIAVFDALPFFGSGAVLWPWAIISMLSADYKCAVGLVIIYFSVIFTRQMIEPKIVSDRIGTPPLATLAAMYAGYKIFSIGGMIFGPVVMMLCISLYNAGLFDGLKELLSLFGCIAAKWRRRLGRSYRAFKKSLEEENDNNNEEENTDE